MTNPLVSVIIPTKNSAQTISACLRSIRKQSYQNIEIIVIDNHSLDETVILAEEHGVKVKTAGNERSAQRNQGARISQGNYLIFIDSDMELCTDVIKECVEKMETKPIIQAIVIPEQSVGTGFIATCKAFERSLSIHVPWMQACRFFRKTSFEAINGFDEACTGTEDFDIHNRVIALFGKESIAITHQNILHNEGKLTMRALWNKKYYYGKSLRIYTAKHHNQIAFKNQSNLAKRIALLSSSPKKILRQPHFFIGAIFMKTVEFTAGGIGYMSQALFPSNLL